MFYLTSMKQGKFFKYPNHPNIYELSHKTGCVYRFKCGHWVTDSVFEDLIDLSTGLAEWQKPKQLKLEL